MGTLHILIYYGCFTKHSNPSRLIQYQYLEVLEKGSNGPPLVIRDLVLANQVKGNSLFHFFYLPDASFRDPIAEYLDRSKAKTVAIHIIQSHKALSNRSDGACLHLITHAKSKQQHNYGIWLLQYVVSSAYTM